MRANCGAICPAARVWRGMSGASMARAPALAPESLFRRDSRTGAEGERDDRGGDAGSGHARAAFADQRFAVGGRRAGCGAGPGDRGRLPPAARRRRGRWSMRSGRPVEGSAADAGVERRAGPEFRLPPRGRAGAGRNEITGGKNHESRRDRSGQHGHGCGPEPAEQGPHGDRLRPAGGNAAMPSPRPAGRWRTRPTRCRRTWKRSSSS